MLQPSLKIGGVLAIVLFACQDENPRPLVKSYSVAWEADLASRYAQPVGAVSFFEHLYINPDGSVVVIHSNSSNESLITKLTRGGAFSEDVKLTGEYISRVCRSEENEMVTLSWSVVNNVIKRWNNTLTVVQTHEVQPSAPLSQTVIHGSSYYIIGSENASTWRIAKFNQAGQLEWEKPYADYGLDGLVEPIFFDSENSFVVAKDSQSADSVLLAKVSASTGIAEWKRAYKKSAFNEWEALGSYLPLVSGGILISGSVYSETRAIFMSVLDSQGFLKSSNMAVLPDLSPGAAGRVLEISDGGFLMVLTPNWQEPDVLFRLMKTNSDRNPIWIETFERISPGTGTVTDIEITPEGNVVILSSDGHLYCLRPNF